MQTQVRRDHEVASVDRRLHQVRVAHAPLSNDGSEHGATTVEVVKVQRVVAVAEGKLDLLSVLRFALEMDVEVSRSLGAGGHRTDRLLCRNEATGGSRGFVCVLS